MALSKQIQAQRKTQSVKTLAKPTQARKQAKSGQLQRKTQKVNSVTKPVQVPKQVPIAKLAKVPTRTKQEQRQDRLQKAQKLQKLRFDRQNHNLQLKMKRNMINENMIKAKAKRGSSAGFWVMVVLIVLGGLGSLMYFIVAPFLGWITNPIGSLTSMFNPKKWF